MINKSFYKKINYNYKKNFKVELLNIIFNNKK